MPGDQRAGRVHVRPAADPRDLSKCAVGQAKYVLICDSDGGIINDPVLTRMDENTFWFALASSDALLFARGLKNAYPDLDVTIQEADVAPLQVQGPKSKDLMVKLLGESILDLKYYYWTHAEIAGAPVVVTRTGWTSEVGYEVYTTDTSKGNDVYEALMKAGEEFNIKPTGPCDIRRIEGAIFNWGADMTYENNPIEMGLDRLVDWDSLTDEACLLARRAAEDPRRRRGPQDRGRGDRRRAVRGTQQREVARDGRRHARSGRSPPRSTRRAWRRTSGTPGSPPSTPPWVRPWAWQANGATERRSRGDAVRRPQEADPGFLTPRSRDRCRSRTDADLRLRSSLNDDSARAGHAGPGRRGGSDRDDQRAAGDAREKRHALLRALVPEVPDVRSDAQAGCTAYDIYNHMYLPGTTTTPRSNTSPLNNDVTLWDVGVERTVEVSGPDADGSSTASPAATSRSARSARASTCW